MFSKATANFVRQIDPDGSLIHVSRVNDSRKLLPMALVVRRKPVWFWQKAKYQPTNFTISDLLVDDTEISPEVCETEFLTYKGTFGGKYSGRLDTQACSVSVELQGRGASELNSCFGKLKKQELDVKKLLRQSGNRLVNMEHVLVRQLKKRADVLAVVTERILTTNSCLVTQTKNEQCTFQGVIGLLDMLGSAIKVSDKGSIDVDSDVSLEIPSDTVIAYSVLELEIRSNGHFDICLQPGTIGGFEADSSASSVPSYEYETHMVDGRCNGNVSQDDDGFSAQQSGLQQMDLSPLAELPEFTQHALFQRLRETMKDRTALSYLQFVLEELCTVESTEHEEPVEHLSRSMSADLSPEPLGPYSASVTQLKAAHLLVSAMEELPKETLNLLSDSSADFLGALHTMMCRLKESKGRVSVQCLPVLLQDNPAFQTAEQLLASTRVTLKRNTLSVWVEQQDEVPFLLLCLSVQGLSLLSQGMK